MLVSLRSYRLTDLLKSSDLGSLVFSCHVDLGLRSYLLSLFRNLFCLSQSFLQVSEHFLRTWVLHRRFGDGKEVQVSFLPVW